MLHGERITLRAMYAAHTDIRNRGAFFPLGVVSETTFKARFAEHGYWQREEGMLVIESPQREIAGHIEFFRPVNYWDAWELSYQLDGRNQDVLLYSLLRDDPRPWHGAAGS